MQEKQILNRISKAEQRIVDLYRKLTGANTPVTPTSDYKSYVVFFSQSGGSNPTITEIFNTVGTVTWARSSAGNFTASAAAGTFPSNKTFIPIRQFCRYLQSGVARNVYISAIGGNLIGVSQSDESATAIDGLSFYLEIRVYN